MAGDSVKAPVLDDLMKWHLYIGFSWGDREPVKELDALLKSKGLICSLRSSLDEEEQCQEDNIKQGILFSHKCLLYISPGYLKDPNSQLEFKKAEKKLQLLGKNSVFGIVKYNVKKEQLGEYEQFQLIYLKDGQTVRDCLTNSSNWDAILSDYELKPELSLVSKENIGVGVAYTYFFSFLQIVVPGVWDSFAKEIQRPSAVKEPAENTFLLKKMLIIIPKTLLSPLKLTDDTNFKRADLSIKQCFDRAGKEKREYTIPIYKLTDETGTVYYFVTDIPSCLYAIREAYESGQNIMSRDDVYETRNDFVLTLKALLNHPENHSKFANQWEMLLWPDDDDENYGMKLSEFVSQQIKSKGLAVKLADVLKQPITGTDQPIQESSEKQKPGSKQTFGYAGGINAYPMYSERPRYALKNCLRGYCIIINNFTFPKFPVLESRSGASTEIEALRKLFEGLKFKVVARENLTEEEMINFLIEYRDKDHSGSDAFVCCLLSHGEKGRINATDGQIPIIKLMELFYDKSCPGLVGKPKLFFIGACQGAGEDEINEGMPSASPPPNPPATSSGTDSDRGLQTEAKKDPEDLGSCMESLALHDSKGAGPFMQCEDREDIVRELVPSGVDFIVSYACLPKTVAWHDSKEGGLYVQALCKHLNQDLEIDVALRHVNQEVRDLLSTHEKKEGKKYSTQDPFHIIMPPQKFLFFGSA